MRWVYCFGCSLILSLGCGGSTEQNAKTAAAYEAEQVQCVKNARTLEESRGCRCEVKKKYGRDCAEDGGAP